MRRTIIVTLIAASFLLLIPAPANAAKGGGKGGGGKGGGDTTSVTLDVVLVNDGDGDGVIDHSDTITFAFDQTETDEPHVDLACRQNGTVVYGANAGYFDGYAWPWTQNMTLESNAWDSGAADCHAELYYFGRRNKTVTIGTVDFVAKA